MSGWNRGFLLGASALVFAALAGLAMAWGGMRIYDVSQPDAPQEMGHWPAVGVSRDVTVAGGYAYVADFHQGLRVVDVSDAAAAQEVAALTWPGRVYGVGKALRLHRTGQRLYVALREDGLAVVDVSDPVHPQTLGRWGEGEDVLDISRPQQVTARAQTATPGQALDMALGGGYILLAAGDAGLLVYAPE